MEKKKSPAIFHSSPRVGLEGMRTKSFCLLGMIAALVWVWAPAEPAAQTQHQHYAESKDLGSPGPDGSLAPELKDLGSHTFPVTTKSERAQLFINQGINLAYGFNHVEAGRAFREAARLDPDCAMAYWGQALVLGPNINAPMNPKNEPVAYELVQQALKLKSKATPREQAYIDTLTYRYSGNPDERKKRDQDYADAMRKVVQRLPDDLDAAALFAESIMDLRPWDYWTRDDRPREGTEETSRVLQSVMKRNPNHPGALHFWIHLMEPTKNPELAEEAADRLLPLVPGAGHLVHMPSHIYVRVGRYEDAARANEIAIRADENYITQCRIQGFYPISYYPHNIHFLWFADTMRGRSQEAIEAARKTAHQLSPEVLKEAPILQFFAGVPYQALVRFAKWDEILKEPPPAYEGPLVVGLWRFARGMAFSAKKQFQEASGELDSLRILVKDPEVAKVELWTPNRVVRVLDIAVSVLEGDMAARQGQYERAVAYLDRGVRLEDGLVYIEPPDWGLPVRHVLGAVLLEAGRPEEAETVYWEDLNRSPGNGWAMFGLAQALRAQGKNEQAAAMEKRFAQAWSEADIKLKSTRLS
jgi:tetratricopeptide (TPR) repeat protein